MSETALTPPNETMPPAALENMFLDGDAPRLGSAPMTSPAPMGGAGTAVSSDAPASPERPLVSPVLSDQSTPMQSGSDISAPTSAAVSSTPAPAVQAPDPAAGVPVAESEPSIPAPSLPTLPTVAPAATPTAGATSTDTASASAASDAEHPMAHLMGGDKVSEASRHAAELRAAKKAKAKKMKIGFAVGALVVSGVVGPPLWSWFSNALNEAGNTSTEAPAD